MARPNPVGLLQKVKVPLFGAYSNRGTNPDQDQRFVNFFPESRKVEQVDQTRVELVLRPPVHHYKTFVPYYSVARGMAFFNGRIYAAYDNNIYEDDILGGGGAPTAVQTLGTSTGKVGFVLGNSSIIGDYLFFCDGVDGFYINTAGVVTHAGADPDFPTPHMPTPVFLDGYICLAKGSDIYSCDLDDPSSWNASNFVSAESFPDPIVGLARQNNQIVAFGSSSTEFFYDAANPSGSPFNRNEAAIIQTGCAANHCIYQNERYCAFIGQSDSGGRAVWFIDGFQPKKVSDEFIERLLDYETDLSNCSGYGLRVVGHMFYIINLTLQNRTIVYDVDEKLWHEWSSYQPDSPPTGAVTSISTHLSYFAWSHVCDAGTGTVYLQNIETGGVGYFHPNATNAIDGLDALSPQPTNVSYIGIIQTNKYDMDTMSRKILHALRIFCDQNLTPNGGNFELYYTDDDYKNWIGTWYIDINDFPSVYALGQFRRRAFKLTYTSNVPLRVQALEFWYVAGIS